MTQKNISKALAVAAVAASSLGAATQANAVAINPRDLVVSVRQPGGTPTDLGIDIGQASIYYSASTTPFTVGQFSSADLGSVYSSFNNLSFSIAGATKAGDGGDASVPSATLWVTQARADVNVQSTPWVSKSVFSQGGTAQRIFGIDAGLVSADATPVGANGAKISDSNAQSYATYIGIGNYQGTFQGNVENNTGSFASSVRSDLYELRPAAGNPVGTYLGFFELSPTGTLSFSSAAVVNAVPDSGSCMIFGGVLLSLIGLKRVSASRE